MIALDTNVLVRYLLADDAAQTRAARALLEDLGTEYFVPITVTLEVASVLRSSKVPRAEIIGPVRDLLSLPNVRPQLAEAVFQALRWAEGGIDIADALHLALSGKAEQFLSFDGDLAKQAARAGVRPQVAAPKVAK
ncbi:MAG: type II toxin-antitoxin system VapC family toxin [Pseudomonadota bacterium]